MNVSRKLIDAVRTKHQLSLVEIANRIDFSRTYVSEVYNEKRQASPDFLARIQRLADIPTLVELMSGEKNAPALAMGTGSDSYSRKGPGKSFSVREEPANHLSDLSMEEIEQACEKTMQDALKAQGVDRLLALISLDKLTKELIQRTQKPGPGH